MMNIQNSVYKNTYKCTRFQVPTESRPRTRRRFLEGSGVRGKGWKSLQWIMENPTIEVFLQYNFS